jgi:hypothetical protein
MDLSSLQDTVLVCAIVTVLVIRLQLWITNYPQLGGGRLHIAHLLWGGLLMLAALVVLLSVLGLKVPPPRPGRHRVRLLVDELGKFIKDNNYYAAAASSMSSSSCCSS